MSAADIVAWLSRHVADSAHLCMDTRQLQAGDVFFACPGLSSDGRSYMEQAVALGAAAIVAEADAGRNFSEMKVPVLQVPALASLLGAVGHLWYKAPSADMTIVAVTGTNGKTTCVQWLAAALAAEAVPCGTIGTLGVFLPDGQALGGMLTTPDVLTVHRSLAAMRQAGAHVVALEASSIGLDQGRLDGVMVDIAGFTNLTHDHLDYHHTLDAYKAAKFALFQRAGLRRAIINADDSAGAELLASLPPTLAVSYSCQASSSADLQALDVHTGSYGLVFNLRASDGTAQLLTRLIAEHNVSNLLLVAGVLHELGWDLHKVVRTLATLQSVEGRLQIIESATRRPGEAPLPLVVVDYAHTPDALERALQALRTTATVRGGKIICVFGCGGNRDHAKRPIMGRIAAEFADTVVLTTDNPRMETPREIIVGIVAGMPAVPAIEPDRALAILAAVWQAEPQDVVLIAGKGHETYQEVQGVRAVFDDRQWAGLALTWLGCAGVSTDSRTLAANELFVALRGESFDGHAYLAKVQQASACAAVVEQADAAVVLPQFVVGDTQQALIRMGTAWRRRYSLPVIAVTGSNGKTTTKEMIASILRQGVGEAASLATRGNLNNHIGVPLTVLRLRDSHRAAVVELGMNHPGEIALLADIAQATVALVNNAQREHQEFMHTVEAVAHENGAVISALPQDGVAVFPGDDTYTALWSEMAGNRRVLRFGFQPDFEVYADQIQAETARTVFQVHTPMGSGAVALAVPGSHNLRNALAAAACCVAAGLPLSAIISGLEAFNPVAGRMQPRALSGGYQLIDDTYNANPDSVRAAIDVLASLPAPRVLVLGDMGEIGANSHAMHAEVGAYARERGIEALLAFGPACAHAAQAFGPAACAFDSIEALSANLATRMPANILVKGSRSTRMERVIKALDTTSINHEEGAGHAT
ncbi:bifunctional UDP-N-acetylmuramoyl-L-alanyl-D-glutamate--2,6-diaminopimelate ligase MurE/UDP-N-acetylmuramoyl-tripeptide--D-alanyl-D-alanine ligase MurF [Pollutimonas thiosulfatoxidans]|uniref:Multifunctional fusion protein n=1 Tax=Pollutimonas thiosulfatoxidans TaxID=2028345 RepID=A0A410GCS9_9BURK|nr:bifunctional UDP-N-acetylmuramoyl-L-alanyl-D-glutamate--2,6-diaminopimelate ligase MurE/UDP-N-acetylmuramoyl-tripeptide--D-alanyl-D-alanine ligase MurF [Pollutimonas thiosulfatoxidans]QAA94085.1 UDP-N-acetylmuramoyl-L-alanyl-D-glutamate--2,6-diaminopimelate ligase [Pollutimonas thiosulfatoxidans]